MRILLATAAFAAVGGTETYILTVADHLLRLGHQVRIYSPQLGDMATLALERGVEVVEEADELGAPADVVVGQDSPTAYALADWWPEVPQAYVCHSALFDHQNPPLVPGLARAVVVMSERVRRRVAALDGEYRIERLTQPIDTDRLVPRRPPSATPRRALILSSYLDGEIRRLLVDTWSDLGVEVVQVGTSTRPTLHPEEDIADADIVVGKSRAVLEGMCCGRAAYVYDQFGSDGWVTPENYAAIEADAIAGQALSVTIDADRLRADLAAYDPAMGLANRTLILKHHQARSHAQQLVGVLAEVAEGPGRPVTEARELARQVRLRWRSEGELFSLRGQFQAQSERHGDELTAARAEVAALTDLLRAANQSRDHTESELAAERLLRAAAERRRNRARARGRWFKGQHARLSASRWVRLGLALRLIRRPPDRRPS